MRKLIVPMMLAAVIFALLVPSVLEAQFEGGRSVLTERKQSYHLGQLWVWTDDEGQLRVKGQMAPLVEQEMTVLNVTSSKTEAAKKGKGSWNGTIGEPIPIDTTIGGALPVVVRMNYRKLDRIDTKRQFFRVLVREMPTDEGMSAIFIECTLADDEEVRCSNTPSTKPAG